MLLFLLRASVLVAFVLCFADTSSAQRRIIAGREYFDQASQTWLDTFLVSDITLDAGGNILRKVDRYDIPTPGVHDIRVQSNFVKFRSHPDIQRKDLGPPDVIDEFLGYDSLIAEFDSVYKWQNGSHLLTYNAHRFVRNGELDSIRTYYVSSINDRLYYDFDEGGLILLDAFYQGGESYQYPLERRDHEYLYDSEGRVSTYTTMVSVYDQTTIESGPTFTYDDNDQLIASTGTYSRNRYIGWDNYGAVVPYAERGPLNSGNTWRERIEDVLNGDAWSDTSRFLQFFDGNGRYVKGERWYEMIGQWRLERIDTLSYYPNGDLRSRMRIFQDGSSVDTNTHIREINYDSKGRVRLIKIREGKGSTPPYTVRYSFSYPVSDVERSTERVEQPVFPNPTSGAIQLPTFTDHILVYDITGAARMELTGATSIDISHLPDGVYTVLLDGKPQRIMKLRK